MSYRALILRVDGHGTLLGPFDSVLDATLACRLSTRPSAVIGPRGVRIFRCAPSPEDRARLTQLAGEGFGEVPQSPESIESVDGAVAELNAMCERLMRAFARRPSAPASPRRSR